MRTSQTKALLARKRRHSRPDPSILSMTMESFYGRYLQDDPHFRADFLDVELGGTPIRQLTVQKFTANVGTDEIVKMKCGMGAGSVAKVRARLGKYNIEWK
ncbi:MAG TPA: hypothetical protein VGE35_03855 [Candidatus Paceibacterota bacterium]